MSTTRGHRPHTPGPWEYASDSYGKVRHSRKACVFTMTRTAPVAQRIENWADARLIAQAPAMLDVVQRLALITEDRIDALQRLGDNDVSSILYPLTDAARALLSAMGDQP